MQLLDSSELMFYGVFFCFFFFFFERTERGNNYDNSVRHAFQGHIAIN